jgi:hypothetical protein
MKVQALCGMSFECFYRTKIHIRIYIYSPEQQNLSPSDQMGNFKSIQNWLANCKFVQDLDGCPQTTTDPVFMSNYHYFMRILQDYEQVFYLKRISKGWVLRYAHDLFGTPSG